MISYRKLFEALFKNKIRYLVAGGVAVNLHQVNRATVDLDLIVHLEPANAKQFVKVMLALGYKPKLPVKADDFTKKEIRKKWAEEKNMMVFSFVHPQNPFEMIDIFVEEPRPFDELEKNKMEVKAFDVTIPVLGLKDLIAMKKEAGRETDLFDVRQLEKIKKNL